MTYTPEAIAAAKAAYYAAQEAYDEAVSSFVQAKRHSGYLLVDRLRRNVTRLDNARREAADALRLHENREEHR